MSNHSSSRLINELLFLLQEYGIFESLGEKRTLTFLDKVRMIGITHKCYNAEILEGIGNELKVCCLCWKYGNQIKDGICEICAVKLYLSEAKNFD